MPGLFCKRLRNFRIQMGCIDNAKMRTDKNDQDAQKKKLVSFDFHNTTPFIKNGDKRFRPTIVGLSNRSAKKNHPFYDAFSPTYG